MAQWKTINGRRYFKSLQQIGTRSDAEQKAKVYRKRGVLARVVHNDRGSFDVFTAPSKRK